MNNALKRRGRRFVVPAVLTSLMLALLVGACATRSHTPSPAAVEGVADIMDKCLAGRWATPKNASDPAALNRMSSFCYEHLRRSYALREFDHRRSAFELEQDQRGVLLWASIGLSVFGAAVSASTLFAAWRVRPPDGVAANANHLSLRLTTTGAIVVTLSLTFFVVCLSLLSAAQENAPLPDSIPPPKAELSDVGQLEPEPPAAPEPASQQ